MGPGVFFFFFKCKSQLQIQHFPLAFKSSRLFKGWVEFLSLLTGHSLLTLIINTTPLYCVNATQYSTMTNCSISDCLLKRGAFIHNQYFWAFSLFNTGKKREKVNEGPNYPFFILSPLLLTPSQPPPLALWVTLHPSLIRPLSYMTLRKSLHPELVSSCGKMNWVMTKVLCTSEV
jgi:hypothetical protein